ncbi:uncharacterized protein VP01_9394g1 [Puccinia sorghi]|uniref:Uncharacterized protein n=1 Tax=Puccinia sorghi TaxID=27349 RepID=A0A0L6U6U6_9BASI|nr:uncharacterized protein VP01_9394g1 [Puccinia sorghi]
MVFVAHAPAIKVAAICMSLQGHSQEFICISLGHTISQQ